MDLVGVAIHLLIRTLIEVFIEKAKLLFIFLRMNGLLKPLHFFVLPLSSFRECVAERSGP